MTTKKLSDLPAAAPILGTETVFGLQSGFSVQIPYGSFNGITTTGNVGIGTSSPSSKLDVFGGYISTANTQLAVGNILSTTATLVAGNWYRIATFPASNQGQTVDITVRLGNTHNNTIIKVAKGTGQWRAEAYRAGYYVNPAANAGYLAINKVRIYDIGVNNVTHIDIQIAGNTSSLTYHVIVDKNTSDIGTNRITLVALTDQGTASAGVEFQAIGTLASWGNNNGQLVTFQESGNVGIGTTSAVIFGSERLTILGDAACLGMKTTGAQGCGLFMNSGSAGTANSGTFIAFYNNSAASNTGNITTTGTITAYTSVSDYRLKNNVLPMSGALNTIALLKPVTYNWVSDSSDGQGFIAHELAEVIPDCVSGEKDAVDADGNPQYQGIDTSFLVATLTAAIQELKAIIDTQQEQINSLLGK